MNRFIIFIIIFISLSGALNANDSTPATGAELPKIKKNDKYANARKELISLGWKPYRAPNALRCYAGDTHCQGRPEMEACSDVGDTPCAWLWQKNGQIIVVSTMYEDDFVVDISRYHSH